MTEAELVELQRRAIRKFLLHVHLGSLEFEGTEKRLKGPPEQAIRRLFPLPGEVFPKPVRPVRRSRRKLPRS